MTDSLFYTPVSVENGPTLNALIDSGSMACTISEAAEAKLLKANPTLIKTPADNVVVVGCGGHRVNPKGIYDVTVSVYGCKMMISVLVVTGQTEELILGSNAIKPLLTLLRTTVGYWKLMNIPSGDGMDESFQFLSLLSNTERWKGNIVPDKVGTAKLKGSVTLQPQSEYLVWGKLPSKAMVSVGSTVVIEPTQSNSRSKQILVGRVITPLFGDGLVPVKLVNPTNRPVTLRRNAKIADVSPCIAVEDFTEVESVKCNIQSSAQSCHISDQPLLSEEELANILRDLGLNDLDLSPCEVSLEWKNKLLSIITAHESIFSRNKMDCGLAKDFVHRIRLVDDKPFRLPYRRIPPSHYEKLRTALNDMEESGIIRKTNSEYASPLVIVWKKNGDPRICNDFRWLNARTVKDAHPLPHQSDALAALGGNAFFSTMDLTSGFYNVPLHEEDKKYTAFSSPFGLHEYNRMPQGLTNSPATFMRMMMSIFGDKNFTSLLCYLDDLLVFAPTEQLALDRLEMVFSRLKTHNLKLSPKKCNFLRRSVKFLGHIVGEDGVCTDPAKVQAITDVQVSDLMDSDGVTPCPKKIRSFLGMVLYYQHFIERCSAKARPLFKLISQPDTQCFKKRGRHPKKKVVNVKLTQSDWTEECQCAFETLKHDLLTSVTLAHPDFDDHFILAVDASFDGLGAVLSQIPRGSDMARPVAFASKTLSRSQMNYPAHRLEFLALKWAVCDKFHYWLKGRHFTAWTDNNPLTYILTKPRLDACEQRWVAKLASYSFDLKYVPGAKNIVADALSREPFVKSSVSHRLVTEPYHALLNQLNGVMDETVQDAFRCTNNCQLVSTDVEPGSDLSHPLSQGKLTSQEISALLDAHCSGGTSRVMGTGVIPHLEKEDCTTALPKSTLRTMQEQDSTVGRVVYYVQRHKRPDKRERAKESRSVIKLLKHWNKLTLQDGMLFKVKRDHNMNKQLYQFIVPDCLKQQVLHGIHDAAGHQGRSRTLSLARHRFFWTGMAHDIVHYVRNCKRCIVGKTPEPNARAPLENIHTTEPMELICIDFWSAEQGDNKSVDVLVATDHFTKMAFAFLCKNQSAKQVARRLWDDIFCIYGFPKRVHSDQGANFESKLIKELLDMAEIKKSHTTPYHPMGNGITERFNRTLGSMIRALPPKSKAKWPQSLRVLTFCYNCTVHETTGFAPFYLMFGRIPRLPIDVMFQHVLKNDLVITHSEFVSHLKRDLSEAAEVAQRHSTAEQARHAKLYDRKVKGSPLTVGDRVLLANRGERGKRKVADKWESIPYEVMSVRSVINVYRVKDTVTGKEKTVHRNLLLPVSFLLRDDVVDLLSDSLSVGAESDPGDALPHDQLDSDEKTLQWILQSGKNAGLDEVVVDLPGSSDALENPPLVDDVVDNSHVCTGRDSDVSQSSFLDDQSAHSHPIQLPSDSPADAHTHVPSSVDSESVEPVICTQPRRAFPGMTMTRTGRTIKPPKRLICEMNDQVVEDSRSSVGSFVTFVRSVFAV